MHNKPFSFLSLILCAVLWAGDADARSAQDPAQQPEEVDVFGFAMPQSERLKISGLFIGAWSHDGMQADLGLEKQARVAQATISFTGRVTNRVRFLVSFNPVNEVAARPACGEPNFFFPNNPAFFLIGAPSVPCDAENGNKRVDTYNTYALDYVNQQGPLREGYVDWRISDAFSARFGRFIEPIGFAPLEVGSWVAKDLTRIQRLNAEANFGLMLAYALGAQSSTNASAPSSPPKLEAAVMGMVGDGDRQKDYDYFYFVNSSLDTNSSLNFIASLRVRPIARLDLRTAYKRGFTGSKVERLPSYLASKRNDDALVISAKARVLPSLSVFGEYARYVWGPTRSSAEMLGVDPEPIVKPGYYVGGTFEVPITSRVRIGTTVTREELSRDDSLVKFFANRNILSAELGSKDRGTIARVYVDVARLATVGFFWANISNPYPWLSGSWPIGGPRAYTGRAPDKYGLAVIVKTP